MSPQLKKSCYFAKKYIAELIGAVVAVVSILVAYFVHTAHAIVLAAIVVGISSFLVIVYIREHEKSFYYSALRSVGSGKRGESDDWIGSTFGIF
jgi:hypothetical protein